MALNLFRIKKLAVSNLAINYYQTVLSTMKTVLLAIDVMIDLCKLMKETPKNAKAAVDLLNNARLVPKLTAACNVKKATDKG